MGGCSCECWQESPDQPKPSWGSLTKLGDGKKMKTSYVCMFELCNQIYNGLPWKCFSTKLKAKSSPIRFVFSLTLRPPRSSQCVLIKQDGTTIVHTAPPLTKQTQTLLRDLLDKSRPLSTESLVQHKCTPANVSETFCSKTWCLKNQRSWGWQKRVKCATLHYISFNMNFFRAAFPANYGDIEIGQNRCQWGDIIKHRCPANATFYCHQNTNSSFTQDVPKAIGNENNG